MLFEAFSAFNNDIKAKGPTTHSLSSSSSLEVWWANAQEYEPLCGPKLVEQGF
jgi:hypothetical protein